MAEKNSLICLKYAVMFGQSFTVKCCCREFTGENLSISNSAAGVLAHLVAEGVEAWTVENPTRDAVRARLREVINTWDLESRRNVRYRWLALSVRQSVKTYALALGNRPHIGEFWIKNMNRTSCEFHLP